MSTETKHYKLLLDTAHFVAYPAPLSAATSILAQSADRAGQIFTAGQLAATEAADQAAAAGSAALPPEVTIPRPASPRTEPPQVAEFLVSWCTKKRYREALLDDLDEDFQSDLSKGMTVTRASRRYWGRALHSITPQLWAAVKRIGIIGLLFR